MIDIEPLLAETSDLPPCGPNLEYDPAYLELVQLASGKPEQQFGTTVIPAEDPPWGEVLSRGTLLLERSKDLHIASIVVRALVHTEGFAGLLPGLLLVHGLVDRFWQHLHPHLEPDEGGDATTRINALAPLASPTTLLRELRDAPLAGSRQHGTVLVRDIEVSLGKLAPRDKAVVLSQAQIDAVLGGVVAEDGAAMAKVPDTLAAAKALASLLDDKVGPKVSPDFKPLLASLNALVQGCGKYIAVSAVPGAPEPRGSAGEAGDEPSVRPPGDIRSRDDALLMIDKIVQYIESHEPTNPAPLLLKRGKRFMSMSFVDIFKEIAPDGMAKLDVIAGPAQKEK